MRQRDLRQRRRGAIIPLVALSLVGILVMVALAIDIGMVAVAKTQCQNAADSAAMAGVRTFNGQTGYNLDQAPINAVTAATANKIFGAKVVGDPTSVPMTSTDVYTSGNVKIECGGYYFVYNDATPASEGFQTVIPGKANTEPYTALRATVTTTSPIFFGSIFGASAFNVKATAIGAHRPRDVVIIMDLSGSMRFQSCPGAYSDGTNWYPHWGPRNISLNPDTLYPQFGHYSDTTTAALRGTASGSTGQELIDPSNLSSTWSVSGPPCLDDFMTSGTTKAFTRDSSKDTYATTPGGDNYLKVGSNYIKTVTEYLTTSSPTPSAIVNFERNSTGYPTAPNFNVYTEGPGYWGKTFFIWPPHPKGSDLDASTAANYADNGAEDWRQKFFFKKNTSTNTLYWLDHNNILFDPAGSPSTVDGSGVTPILKRPQDTTTVTENGQNVTYRYCINYAAIFNWLRSTPVHFPSSMTSGRIKFYSSIPDPSDTTLNNRFWTTHPLTNVSERFWKDYVDFMLGQVANGANSYDNKDPRGNSYTADIGNGDFYQWGTPQIRQKPDCNFTATVSNSGGYSAGTTPTLNLTNVKDLSGTTADLPGPQPITGATNASPIVITSNNHGLSNGSTVTISGVTGNTAANGTWLVANVTTTTFQIKTLGNANTTGNANFTSTGTGAWIPAITAITAASPIVITTGFNHNLVTGQTISIANVTGVTAANNDVATNRAWTITKISATSFSLDGSTGTGNFSGNSANQPWWEPVFYVRFGYGSTFYELNPILTTSGTLSATPDINLTTAIADATAVKIYTSVPKYMDYADNTYRPRHQFWFGPQTWADWLGNYTVYTYANGTNTLRWPGNVHEAQAWACKIGISAAIDDIKNNHPNDFVALTFFSSPSYSTSGGGQHNMAVIPLGRNYSGLKDSLWFPPSTVSGTATTITPYDADFNNVPRAKGGTCPQMGLMIAFNLLSSSATNLRTYATPSTTYRGFAGGLGRKGATRLVIFETDGAPNTRAVATLAGTGSNSYYPIRIKDPTNIADSQNEFPTGATWSQGYANSEVYPVVQQIVALDTASPPGYSTLRKPAYVYGVGYGSMFDSANSTNSGQAGALTFLQTLQYNGGVAADTTGSNFPDWQRIYGDNATRQTRLQAAFTKIMQSGVQVSVLR